MAGTHTPLHRFLDWMERFRGREVVFRGVDDEQQMWPIAVRSFFRSRREDPGAANDEALADFRRYEAGLLDWSRSPVVALYFAAARPAQNEGRLYGYDWGSVGANVGIIELSSQPGSPFTYDGEIGRFAPPVISRRMADQQAVFTIQGNPLQDIHIVAKAKLHWLDIAPSDRTEILIELFRLGISASALFRDLPGVAETLRWIYEDYI